VTKHEKTILIADDEEDITWSISKSLQRDKKPIQILCSNSGEETIELLKKHSVDVLVTDLRMPGVDGFSVIKYIGESFLKTKIIVITAYGSSEIKDKIFNKGCYHYLEKPFDISTLKQKIYSILDNNVFDKNACGSLNNQIHEMLQLTKKTPDILLTIYQGKAEGKLYSSYGEIYHAAVGKKQGLSALNEILCWKNAFIKVQSDVRNNIRSIDKKEMFN
jgi:DNA-binding NtrC family response regulator